MRGAATREAVRDAILDATDRRLARFGYKKMTIDELAQEVGIGKGTVYLHFRSKEDLALSHVDRIVYRLLVKLQTIAHDDAPAPDRLRQMLVTRVLHRFDSVQHYTQSLNEMLAHLRAKLLDRRTRYFQEEASIFADLIAEGVRAGEFDTKRPLAAAGALLDATNSLLPYSLSVYELGDRGEIEKKVARVADLVLDGLIKR